MFPQRWEFCHFIAIKQKLDKASAVTHIRFTDKSPSKSTEVIKKTLMSYTIIRFNEDVNETTYEYCTFQMILATCLFQQNE